MIYTTRRGSAARRLALPFAAGLAITCGSVAIHRDLVFAREASFGGGWPIAYLVDRPGISVTGTLSLIDDAFYPIGFGVDWLFWSLSTLFLAAISRRVVRRRCSKRVA